MEALTGLNGSEWFAFGLLLVALALAARSLGPIGRIRGGRKNLIPLAIAAALAAVVVLILPVPGNVVPRLAARPINIAVLVGFAVVAVALVDFLYGRVLPRATALFARIGLPSRYQSDAGLVLVLVPVLVVSALLATRLVAAQPTSQPGQAIVESLPLPDAPMGIAMRGETDGFVSLGHGQLLHFELPSAGGPCRARVVAEGLENPRGLAVVGDRLYFGELGPLPCRPEFPVCNGRLIAATFAAGEEMILRTSRGRISSFSIAADASLSDRRADVTDLPVTNTDHGVNGMEIGPDGALYVSIGNIDGLWQQPALALAATPHAEWLGTILRLDPETGQLAIYARGLRNVYEVAFDDRGGLWGVDNDGPTRSGWRAEEVLRLREGAHYGYPFDGTYGARTVRTDAPVWLLDAIGSAGLTWAGTTPLGPGLLSGSWSRIDFVPLALLNGEWAIAFGDDRTDVRTILETRDCVSTVVTLADGRILAGLFSYGGTSSIALIRIPS